MIVDEAGAIWLSDPLLVAVLLVGAVSIVYWCHRWLEDGRAPMPRTMTARIRDRAVKQRIRTRQAIRPSVVTVARLEPAVSTRPLRALPNSGYPRNAA